MGARQGIRHDSSRARTDRDPLDAIDLAAADLAHPSTLGFTFRQPTRRIPISLLSALAQAVFGETSPLYKSLVLDEQKVVLLAADAELKRDPAMFTVVARIRSAEDLDGVKKRIEDALAEAAKAPIPTARLEAIKSHLRYAFANSLDSPDAVAMAVSESIALTGRPDSMEERPQRLRPADARRLAARGRSLLRPDE